MIPQVKKEYYFRKTYNNLERFISYYYQTSLIADYAAKGGKVLEVGAGSGLVSSYLRSCGFEVVVCDIDKNLNPDVLADVRSLPFRDGSFDAVAAFEVLEHLPWEDFEKALAELKRVSRGYVIISLPYRSTGFEFVFRFPGIRTLFKKNLLDIFLRIPLRFGGIKTSGQHYWEIDGYNHRLGKVAKVLERHFSGVKKIRPVLDHCRLFFVLGK